jgi:GNAT superfamily N-acetyltransferase
MTFDIRPYQHVDRTQVLALSMRAWNPVFSMLEPAVPAYVYKAFYPHGWQTRQTGDIEAILDGEGALVGVAATHETILGWVGIHLHPKDRMREIYILAVDLAHQRQGVGTALMDAAIKTMRDAGMEIVMVETGDDPGHAPSRGAYERAGFERWPVARYFRKLYLPSALSSAAILIVAKLEKVSETAYGKIMRSCKRIPPQV